jgi:thiaminase/transcriptional activator TenA
MGFVAEMRARAAAIWAAEAAHPFVRGVGDGTLDVARFKYYVAQDYLFLIEFVRVLGLAVAKSTDLATMQRFTELQHMTLTQEMELHRGYCARFGITAADLEAARPSPTTYAYTRHLLTVAYAGTAGEIEAALLPCQWGYAEIGAALAAVSRPEGGERAALPYAPLYEEWVRMYASPEYQALAAGMCDLMEELAAHAGEDERRRMMDHFLTSSRYEYLFWEAAYTMEQWPA